MIELQWRTAGSGELGAILHAVGIWRVLQIRYVTNMEVQHETGVQPIWSEWKDVPVEVEG